MESFGYLALSIAEPCAYDALPAQTTRDKNSTAVIAGCFMMLTLKSEVFVGIYCSNKSIFIISKFCNLYAAQMCDAFAQTAVVVKQIPLAFKFNNGMMAGPTHYRIEYSSRVRKGTIWIVADGIAEKMSIPGRIREIIFAIVFM